MRKQAKSKRHTRKPAAAAKPKQTTPDTEPREVPVHVLIRVRSEDGRTIDAHANVAATHGATVFGKIGKPIGPAFRKALNEQIARGTKTYLFMTTREGWNGPYVTYRCPLRRVHDDLDVAKRKLVPAYYLAEAPKIQTWFEVSSLDRLSRQEMNRIFVLSSGRSVMSVIKSTAAVFRVSVNDADDPGY